MKFKQSQRVFRLAVAFGLGLLAVPAGATVIYSLDDGTGEMAVGCGACDIVWGNHFLRAPGGGIIRSVSVAFGFYLRDATIMNGTPVVASIWSDPNNDGNPSDAILLASVSGAAANWATDTFNTYEFPGVAVGLSFFAAVSLHDPGIVYPARSDLSSGGSDSWIGIGPSLTNATIHNSDVNWGGYMIRAEGEVPEPASLFLLGSGLLGLMALRRRAS